MADFLSDVTVMVILLYLLEGLLLVFHALRHRAGLFPAGLFIAIVAFFMMLTDPLQVRVFGPRGLTIPVNSVTMFPVVLLGVLLIYITEGTRATWILFGCLLGTYGLVLGASALGQLWLHWPGLQLAASLSGELFPLNVLGLMRSAAAFAVDIAVIVWLFTLLTRRAPGLPAWVAVCVSFAGALVTDGVIYPLLSRTPPSLTLGHILGKIVVSVLVSLPLSLYLRRFSPHWLREEIVGAEHFDLFQASGDLQRSLQISERRFRQIIDQSPMAILGFNRRGRVILWNRASELLYGLGPAEAQGRPAAEFLCDGSVEQLRAVSTLIGRTFEGEAIGEAIQSTLETRGRRHHVRGHIFPLRGAGGEVLFGVAMIHDITPIVEMERALLKAKERLEEVVNSIREGMAVVDRDHVVQVWNRAAAKLTGIPTEQVVGRPVREALPGFLGAPTPAGVIERVLTHAEPAVIEHISGPGRGSQVYEIRMLPFADGVTIFFTEVALAG